MADYPEMNHEALQSLDAADKSMNLLMLLYYNDDRLLRQHFLTKNHNIYTGVCIDTASTLGMCGERNAIANMITNGENEISKLVCVDSKGKVGSPCGACREYLMQLDKNSKNIEILKDDKTKEIIKLEELLPDWWGYDRV